MIPVFVSGIQIIGGIVAAGIIGGASMAAGEEAGKKQAHEQAEKNRQDAKGGKK